VGNTYIRITLEFFRDPSWIFPKSEGIGLVLGTGEGFWSGGGLLEVRKLDFESHFFFFTTLMSRGSELEFSSLEELPSCHYVLARKDEYFSENNFEICRKEGTCYLVVALNYFTLRKIK
jgi:hypothetical protein